MNAVRYRFGWVLVIGACCVGTLVPASAASGSTPGWHTVTSPNKPGPNGRLNATSCPSQNQCISVGTRTTNTTEVHDRGLAESWNGQRWTVQTIPTAPSAIDEYLNDVSCATGSFCVAIGSAFAPLETSVALIWSGGSWSQSTLADNTDELASVDCDSTTHCVVVSRQGRVQSWNGKSWVQQYALAQPTGGSAGLSAVSCSQPAGCVAVGSQYVSGVSKALSLVWDGTTWSRYDVPATASGNVADLYLVSCASQSSCTAVGGAQDTQVMLRWNGSKWLSQANPNGMSVHAISCPATSSCVVVGDGGTDSPPPPYRGTWNGTKWTTAQLPAPPGASVSDVSCFSATSCFALGSQATFLFGDRLAAGSWGLVRLAMPAGAANNELDTVSCPAPGECLAIGTGGDGDLMTMSYQRGSWKLPAALTIPAMKSASLSGIFCEDVRRCIAVGHSLSKQLNYLPLAATLNGTSWTTMTGPSPTNAVDTWLSEISCSSPSSCVAGGGFSDKSFRTKPIAEVWNGTTWTLTNIPSVTTSSYSEITSLSCPSANYCLAIVQFTDSMGADNAVVVQWNGQAWTRAPSAPAGTKGFVVESLSCTAPTACTAVGHTPNWKTLAQRWDGTQWVRQQTPNPDDRPDGAIPDFELMGVSCAAATSCDAYGRYFGEGFIWPFIESWNGSRWTVHEFGIPRLTEEELDSISCASPSFCAAVGKGNSEVSRTFVLMRS